MKSKTILDVCCGGRMWCRAQLYIKTYERGDSAFENIIKQAVRRNKLYGKLIRKIDNLRAMPDRTEKQ